MINYERRIKDNSPLTIDVVSAWSPLADIIGDIMVRFEIPKKRALEFGVERGFSTSVLAHYFKEVIGIDKFDWIFTDGIDRTFEVVKNGLSEFVNIKLIQSSYQDYISTDNSRYDLIHVDVGYDTHEYEPSLECGEWAVNHSDCVLFHDTISFPGVNKACEELSEKYGFDYYNFEEEIGPAGIVCGLGILIKRK